MFRHLKNFYFLSLKSNRINNGQQKCLEFSRISLKRFSSNVKVLELILKQTNDKDWNRTMHGIRRLTLSSDCTAEYKVLQCCEENQLSKQAMSFVQYLLKNNKLTYQLLKKFLDLTRKDPKNYEPSQPLISMLFTKYLNLYPTIAQRCALTLFHYPVQFDNVFKIYLENIHILSDHEKAITCLFSCNRVEEALELYLRTLTNVGFQLSLLGFLEKELRNERIPSKLTEVVQHIILHLDHHNKFLPYSSEFSNILSLIDKIDKNYKWSIESFPSRHAKCEFCGENLERSSVTKKEMQYLLATLKTEVVYKNIFIVTFKEKWNVFLQFLKTINYNIVIDGMNIYYTCNCDIDRMKVVLGYIAGPKNRLLIITKQHTKRSILNSKMCDISSVFYTDNDEDDDIYILYAALRQGLGCWIFTRDKYSFFKDTISPDFHEMYGRWKETHVGTILRNGLIVWPISLKSGLKKGDCSDPSEFKYHIVSNTIDNYPIVSCITKRKRKCN